jgi:hypothetical protein
MMITNALILQSSCEFNLAPGGGALGESELLVLLVGSIIGIAAGDGRGAGVY